MQVAAGAGCTPSTLHACLFFRLVGEARCRRCGAAAAELVPVPTPPLTAAQCPLALHGTAGLRSPLTAPTGAGSPPAVFAVPVCPPPLHPTPVPPASSFMRQAPRQACAFACAHFTSAATRQLPPGAPGERTLLPLCCPLRFLAAAPRLLPCLLNLQSARACASCHVPLVAIHSALLNPFAAHVKAPFLCSRCVSDRALCRMNITSRKLACV